MQPKNKQLTQEKSNPCMKCGSVQCAFCSDDVLSAVNLLKSKMNPDYPSGIILLEVIDECFPVFKEGKTNDK